LQPKKWENCLTVKIAVRSSVNFSPYFPVGQTVLGLSARHQGKYMNGPYGHHLFTNIFQSQDVLTLKEIITQLAKTISCGAVEDCEWQFWAKTFRKKQTHKSDRAKLFFWTTLMCFKNINFRN
jgi:hypothetical protein